MSDKCKKELGLHLKKPSQYNLEELNKLKACRKEKRQKMLGAVKEKTNEVTFNVKNKIEGNKKRERSNFQRETDSLIKANQIEEKRLKRLADSIQQANPNAKFIKITNQDGKRKIIIGKNK